MASTVARTDGALFEGGSRFGGGTRFEGGNRHHVTSRRRSIVSYVGLLQGCGTLSESNDRDGFEEQHDRPSTITGRPGMPGARVAPSSIWRPPF